MKLILNGINGEYLRNIVEQVDAEVRRGGDLAPERVDAAVAYATDLEMFFERCWERRLPLRFFGRFDESVPVSVPVLRRFLDRRSPNYVCKLVRMFHPKVIWWRGFGAYIGSANLTQSAWHNNVEAGVFIADAELVSHGFDLQLEEFFVKIDQNASPLTEELFEVIRIRDLEINRIKLADQKSARDLQSVSSMRNWEGLGVVSRISATSSAEQNFLNEWNDTLQILRDIAHRVSEPANRPIWVGADAPTGAQADQFLNAYYYQRTFDGRRSDYEAHFQRSKANPEKALSEAINWWRKLPEAPSGEDRMLNDWAPFLREKLDRHHILRLNEQDILNVFSRVHAIIEYARRVSNAAVGLSGTRSYTRDEKIAALAKVLSERERSAGAGALTTLNYVLYDGSPARLPSRLWTALTDPAKKIEFLGVSSLGELVGWALPELFPPRNGRTSKALRSLGYDVHVHTG